MNILLVEPDKVLGQTATETFEALGHTVSWKRTAQRALDAMDEATPDLIILELQLGLHNGIELLYELASYPEWRDIPVVVHTINPRAQEPDFAEALRQLKVRTVLYKPLTSTSKLVTIAKQYA